MTVGEKKGIYFELNSLLLKVIVEFFHKRVPDSCSLLTLVIAFLGIRILKLPVCISSCSAPSV